MCGCEEPQAEAQPQHGQAGHWLMFRQPVRSWGFDVLSYAAGIACAVCISVAVGRRHVNVTGACIHALLHCTDVLTTVEASQTGPRQKNLLPPPACS